MKVYVNLCTLIFLFSCSVEFKKKDSKESKLTSDSNPLFDNWQDDCEVLESERASDRVRLEISPEKLVTRELYFDDADCKNNIFYCSYTTDVLSTDSGKLENSATTSASVSITDKDFLSQANDEKFCGFSDWELNLAKETGTATCTWQYSPDEISRVDFTNPSSDPNSAATRPYTVKDGKLILGDEPDANVFSKAD